jgi:hypothetical protein
MGGYLLAAHFSLNSLFSHIAFALSWVWMLNQKASGAGKVAAIRQERNDEIKIK